MTVRHELSRCTTGIREAKAVNNIIESCLQNMEKRFNGHAAFAQRTLENAPELSFKQSVLISQFLFFAEGNRVIGLLAPGAPRAMDAGWIIFSLQRFRRTENWHAIPAAHFGFWSSVSSHVISLGR
jgi:hypothetical protein